MDTTPLVADEIEAGAEFLRRLNAKRRVLGACWLRQGEGERYLYVAVEGVSDGDKDAAFADVADAVDEMTDHYFDLFRIKVLSPNSRISKGLLDHYRRYPKRTPTRPTLSIASLTATDYVYPPLEPVAQS